MAKVPKKKVAAPKGAELRLETKSELKGKKIQQEFYNSVGGERTRATMTRSNPRRVADSIREEKVKDAFKVGKNPQPTKQKKVKVAPPRFDPDAARKTARMEATRKKYKK